LIFNNTAELQLRVTISKIIVCEDVYRRKQYEVENNIFDLSITQLGCDWPKRVYDARYASREAPYVSDFCEM